MQFLYLILTITNPLVHFTLILLNVKLLVYPPETILVLLVFVLLQIIFHSECIGFYIQKTKTFFILLLLYLLKIKLIILVLHTTAQNINSNKPHPS